MFIKKNLTDGWGVKIISNLELSNFLFCVILLHIQYFVHDIELESLLNVRRLGMICSKMRERKEMRVESRESNHPAYVLSLNVFKPLYWLKQIPMKLN